MATPAPKPSAERGDHGKRVIVGGVVLSVVATALVAVLGGRFLPPGNGSVQASGQVLDNTVMLAIVTPVIVGLAVFFVYVLSQFRHRGGALVDGPPLRDDPQVRVWWIVVTSVTVLFLAGFGTYELLQNGSGGGQGPDPIAVPAGTKLPVQVIAQQWQFFPAQDANDILGRTGDFLVAHVKTPLRQPSRRRRIPRSLILCAAT